MRGLTIKNRRLTQNMLHKMCKPDVINTGLQSYEFYFFKGTQLRRFPFESIAMLFASSFLSNYYEVLIGLAEREAPEAHHEDEAAMFKESAKAPTAKPPDESPPTKATSTCELLYHVLSQ